MNRLPPSKPGKNAGKPSANPGGKPTGKTDGRTAKIIREMIGNLKANADPKAARAFDAQKEADEERFMKAGKPGGQAE